MSESQIPVRQEDEIQPVLPDYGVFLRTPADGHDWIHPADRSVIDGLIPSERVFCRTRFEDGYYHFRYGDIRFRLRPCLWLPVVSEGIDIGDQVETIGVGLQVELLVSEVIGMYYSMRERRIEYQLAAHPVSERLYTADQLRLLSDKQELHPSDTFVRIPEIGADDDAEPLHLAPDQEPDHGTDE